MELVAPAAPRRVPHPRCTVAEVYACGGTERAHSTHSFCGYFGNFEQDFPGSRREPVARMFRYASELTAALDDLQAHVTHALQIDPSTSAVNASGEILGRVQKAKNICSAICDATLKQSPLAAMAQDQLGSPKKGKGVHGFVKAVYTPSPPRPEDEQVPLRAFS